jgi:hypothetical protein
MFLMSKMVINIGVIPMPYIGKKGLTTKDTATFMESKFGLFTGFAEKYTNKMTELAINALVDALNGEKGNLQAQLESDCTELLKGYLNNQETGHSLKPKTLMRSSRMKKKAKKARKPFMDTYTLYNSLTTWVSKE